MSIYSRDRKKRLRDFDRIYLRKSESIKGWKLWQVHVVPDHPRENQEIDFWGHSGKDVILVTLQNSPARVREITTGPREPLRAFVHFPFEKVENAELIKLVDELDSGKICKRKKKR